MRHCWPVGDATEMRGEGGGMASELKQTRRRPGWLAPGDEAVIGGRRVGDGPFAPFRADPGGHYGAPHAGGPRQEIVVVAPSSNFSGAGAAVGSVTDGTRIVYQRARVSGAEGVDAYGLDAS